MLKDCGHFVLLRHHRHADPHWDLMLEMEHALATWQLAVDPVAGEQTSQPARALPDHRRAYLDYEGAISGNRGHVTRTDRGQYTLIRRTTGEIVIQLSGEKLAGQYQLTHIEGDRWAFGPRE